MDVSEVNRLVKQFEQTKKFMKQMPGMMGGKKGRRGGGGLGGLIQRTSVLMDFIKGISCFVNKSIYFTFDIYYSINL